MGTTDSLLEGLAERIAAAAGKRKGRWLANLWREEGVRVEARSPTDEAGSKEKFEKELERWSSAFASVQVELSPGKVGFASAPVGLGEGAGLDAEGLIGRAVSVAQALGDDPALTLPDELGSATAGELGLDDHPWEAEALAATCLSMAHELGEAVAGVSEEIDSVRKPTVEAVREGRLIALGSGAGYSAFGWSGSEYSAQVEAAARRGDFRESSWAAASARSPAELNHLAVGLDAGVRTSELLGAGEPPTGRFDVVLDWRVTVQLLELLAPSLIGENHRKGTTFLAGKLGSKVFSDKVSLTDEGLKFGGPGTQPLDEEGQAQRTTPCMAEGRLERLLFDRVSAKRETLAGGSAVTTGNAAGSPNSPPATDITNLIMSAGSRSPQELIASLGKGLWVREVMGLHTADTVSGDFSIGVSGLWIEGGKVVAPVSGGAFSGNLLELFASVAEVGSDQRFMGQVAAPSVIVEGAELAGDGQL